MKRLLSYWLLSLGGAMLSLSGAERPNVVFILADDIGYGDLACYGGQHAKTPNLDRLAQEGLRFTDAHAPASTCTPTRRALMTGVYSWRQRPASGILPGDAPLGIRPGTVTLPSLLKQAGYATAVVGKWHLGLGGPMDDDGTGPKANWNGEIKPGPLELGFDYAFIMPATGDRVPTVFVENHRMVGLDPNDPISLSYSGKVGTLPTDRENPDRLKLKHTHGHDMTIVNGVGRIGWMSGGQSAWWRDEDMADTFATKAIDFIHRAVTEKKQPFFLYLATHDIHVPRVPHERFQGVTGRGARADAIVQLDHTVGRVVEALRKAGVLHQTLVIFTSDNGGVMDDGYEDFAPGDYQMNGVLRGTKATVFEGGHRVPFIARWPDRIRPGTQSDALLAHLDMPATLAALAGVTLPNGACRDSVNVLPALLGESKAGRETFIAHVGGVNGPVAIRHGPWKYIQPPSGRRGGTAMALPAARGMLFNLAEDMAEQRNLVEKQPERAAELQALLVRAGAPGTANVPAGAPSDSRASPR